MNDFCKIICIFQKGFCVSVAKRACIEVKNESVEKALDEALKIKEEEIKAGLGKISVKKETDGLESLEIHVNQVKPFWDCEMCTY